MLICICGYAGSGKDTIANIHQEEYGFEVHYFADKVRELALLINSYFPQVDMKYEDIIKKYGYDTAKRKFSFVREYIIKIAESIKQVMGKIFG